MKINRFVALAAIALLVVGAMGAVSLKAFARSNQVPAAQVETCDQQDDDSVEVDGTPDTDDMELECGDQNEDSEEAKSENGQDTPPTGTPAIQAEEAQVSAEDYLNAGASVKVELDDEDGNLVYSVEFSDGTDVKVDAMTGGVLGVDSVGE